MGPYLGERQDIEELNKYVNTFKRYPPNDYLQFYVSFTETLEVV